MSVERFDPHTDCDFRSDGMVPQESGEYVRYEDYTALQQKLNEHSDCWKNEDVENLYERVTDRFIDMVKRLCPEADIDTSPGESEHETTGHIIGQCEEALQQKLEATLVLLTSALTAMNIHGVSAGKTYIERAIQSIEVGK